MLGRMSNLPEAAFQAWLVLGEILLDFTETRRSYRTKKEEVQDAYDALLAALKEEPGFFRERHPGDD